MEACYWLSAQGPRGVELDPQYNQSTTEENGFVICMPIDARTFVSFANLISQY